MQHHPGAPVAPPAPPRARRGALLVLTGLSGGHGVFHWFIQSFLVMLPNVQATFGLTPVQVGAITATREVASGAITVPGGIVGDVFRRQWGVVLAACMGGFGLGWLLVGASPVYPLLLAGVALASMAASLWHLPAMASLSHRFAHRRGAALSFHGVGGSLGDVVGPLLTGLLLAWVSWQGLLSVYAAVPLLLALVVFWAFRDIGQQGADDAAARPTLGGQLRETLRLFQHRLLLGVVAVAGLRAMAFVAFVTFLPLYIANELGLGTEYVGAYISLLTLVGIFASPVLGYLSDRFGRKPVLVPSLLALSLLSLALMATGDSLVLFTVVVALLGVFLHSDQPILHATALDLIGHHVATTTLGVFSFSRFALAGASPLIAGKLYEAVGIHAAFAYAAGLFALAALLFLPLRLARPQASAAAAHRHGGGDAHDERPHGH